MLSNVGLFFVAFFKRLGKLLQYDKTVVDLLRQRERDQIEHRRDRDEWRRHLAENGERWRELNDSYQEFAADVQKREDVLEGKVASLQISVELERGEHRKCRVEIDQWRERTIMLEDENRELKKRVAMLEGAKDGSVDA